MNVYRFLSGTHCKRTYYWWSGISEGVETVNETLDQHFPAGAHHRNLLVRHPNCIPKRKAQVNVGVIHYLTIAYNMAGV